MTPEELKAQKALAEPSEIFFVADAMTGQDALTSASAFHEKIGVTEVYVEDGVAAWAQLRDALANDEVVVLQGDRVMPGHKGRVRPFLHGRLEKRQLTMSA